MRIDAVLHAATERLKNSSSSARLDAELLLAHVLDKNRSYLYAWPEVEPSAAQLTQFGEMLEQRLNHYPVAYSVGYQEFWSMRLMVSPDVLIPRADTELLVETALEKLQGTDKPNILELGTGSGAIALALASERPDATLLATDFSAAALEIARQNQLALGMTTIRFFQSDWFDAIEPTTYDLIISNPPYIDPQDPHLNTGIRYEPLSALAADDYGLAELKSIAQSAPAYLKPAGWLMLEHGYDQGAAVTTILRSHDYRNVCCLKDLAGNDRITIGQSPA